VKDTSQYMYLNALCKDDHGDETKDKLESNQDDLYGWQDDICSKDVRFPKQQIESTEKWCYGDQQGKQQHLYALS